MIVKDISEYPFIKCVYDYMSEVDFIETESSKKVREEINNAIYGILDIKTMIKLDDLINAIANEQYSEGFLNGYIVAVRIMRGQTIFRKS